MSSCNVQYGADQAAPSRENVKGRGLAPLKISKHSHQIHKGASSSTSSDASRTNKMQNQQRQPVIIYTHSPKVITTTAHDFMALVQKLTGRSAQQDENPAFQKKSDDVRSLESPCMEVKAKEINITDQGSDSFDTIHGEPSALLDPAFAPNSCSSIYPLHMFQEMLFCPSYPGTDSSISPAITDYLKPLEEI